MQFRRRRTVGFLVVVTGLLLLLGGHYWVQSIRYNRAIARVHDLEGEITTYSTYPAGVSWLLSLPGSQYLPIETEQMGVSLENSRLDNVDLDFLKDLPHLRLLNLSNESVTDRVLLTLPDLDSLQMLELRQTQVSAQGLQKVLKKTPNLEDLWLCGTKVKDEDLVILKTLPKLVSVGLSDTQITDVGVEYLQGFPNLTSVGLSETQITDAGLKHLLGLPNLQSLYLNETSITPAGLETLQKLPRLRHLMLRGIEINVDDVPVFVGMKNLDYLILDKGQLASEVLLRLKSEMPQLQVTLLEPE